MRSLFIFFVNIDKVRTFLPTFSCIVIEKWFLLHMKIM